VDKETRGLRLIQGQTSDPFLEDRGANVLLTLPPNNGQGLLDCLCPASWLKDTYYGHGLAGTIQQSNAADFNPGQTF
jgi:hypothetical protein